MASRATDSPRAACLKPLVYLLKLAKLHKNWECVWSTQENSLFVIMWILNMQLTGGTEQIWVCAGRYDQSAWTALTRLEMMDTLQAQVCGCIRAHRRLPDKKMNRETSDAWKSQLNQAIWNSTPLKFGSENQLNIHNYLLILFSDLPLIALSGKVTLLRVWLGVLRTPGVQVPDIEECENHRNLRKNKFWKIQCIHIGNGRRALPPLVFEIWHFPIKFKQKMFS